MFSRLQRNIVKNAILFIYFYIVVSKVVRKRACLARMVLAVQSRVPAKILAGPAIAKRACVHAYLDGR